MKEADAKTTPEKPSETKTAEEAEPKQTESPRSIVGIVLGSVVCLSFVLFMGCVYNYRYQVKFE